MVVRREKKVRKQRGSRFYGWGRVGQHRKSGTRGGFGRAGMHKHKWTWVLKHAPDYFGKRGFKRPEASTRKLISVNIGTIAESLDKFPIERDSLGRIVVDLTKIGRVKVLGGGSVDKPLVVKASYFTDKAMEKIKEAGGEVITIEV